MRPRSLGAYLSRLIWLCVLPLLLLVLFLAAAHVRVLHVQRNRDAQGRALDVVAAVDRRVEAQIAALQLLAASPLLDDPSRRGEFFVEARAFHQRFAGHVILADLSLQMLLNTRSPLGTALPKLPQPKGHAAVPAVLATGKPAVGDVFPGPIAREPLVAVVVPVVRDGGIRYLLLSTVETRQFQDILDGLSLPAGWSLSLIDGKSEEMARRGRPERDGGAAAEGTPGRFVVRSTATPWSVVLKIQPGVYRSPILTAAVALIAAIVVALLVSILVGRVASRQLARSVEGLAGAVAPGAGSGAIAEIEEARRRLSEAAAAREAAVSARLESEEHLLQAHGRLRRFVDANIVGVVTASPSGEVIEANDYYLRLVGYTREEFERGLVDWRAITPPEWLAADERAIAELRERGRCTPYEKEYVRRDGTRVAVFLSDAMLPGPEEQIVAFALDVSEQRRAEAGIRVLNERLQHLILAVQELASAHSLEDVQRIVAQSARRLTGADGAAMVLRDGEQCFYADEEAIEPLWKGKRFPLTSCISGWVMLHRTPAVIPDIYADERIPLDAYRPTFVKSLTMVPVNTGEPVAAIGTYWSTSYLPSDGELQLLQTLADAAARAIENVRLLEHLDQRVRERTTQLEAANRELEAFSYSVSHDLRAPLRAVDGYTQILMEEYASRLDAEGRRVCAVISESARNMGKLIDDLLSLSRVGRAGMQSAVVDMAALARAVYQELVPPPERERIAFRVGPLPAATGDPVLLRQVWTNLLSNAVKFSSKRERAEIDVSGGLQDGGAVYRIRDNGAGFDMEYAGKLFGVFQRLHSAREFEGTGVGLAIVQRIVQRHGGRVWAEAVPEHGASFSFLLPADGPAGTAD